MLEAFAVGWDENTRNLYLKEVTGQAGAQLTSSRRTSAGTETCPSDGDDGLGLSHLVHLRATAGRTEPDFNKSCC